MLQILTDISLQEDGRTLSGRILEARFLDGAKRGDWGRYYSKDGKFYLASWGRPELYKDGLYIWGNNKEDDNREVSCTYSSREEALKVLDYINEFSIKESKEEDILPMPSFSFKVPMNKQEEISLPNELEINGITYIRK